MPDSSRSIAKFLSKKGAAIKGATEKYINDGIHIGIQKNVFGGVIFMPKKTFEQHMGEVNALPEEEREQELRIRVDQAVIDKLKEFKKELDAPSYNSALRKLLGVKENEPVVEKAIARIQENIDKEKKIRKLNKKLQAEIKKKQGGN